MISEIPDTRYEIRIIRLVAILIFFLLAISHWPLANYCFSQESPPLSYYEIIEKRNFFKPKMDDSSLAKKSEKDKETIKKLSDKYASESSFILEFRLTGIIKLKNKFKAIVEKKDRTEGFYVGVGDSLKDYTVNSIEKNKVILEKNGQEYTLRLEKTASQQELKLEGNFNLITEKEKVDDLNTELRYPPSMIQDLRSGGSWKNKQEQENDKN